MKRNLLINGGFALALVILTLLGWLQYQSLESLTNFEHWEHHTITVDREFNGLLSALEGVETGVRGFVNTGENKFLDPYHAALTEIDRRLANLRREIEEGTHHENNLGRIESLIRERLAIAGKTVELRRTAGFQAAYQEVIAGKDKYLMSEIRRQVAGANQAEDRLLQDFYAEEQADINKASLALIVGGITSFSLLIAVFLLLRREIGRRGRAEAELIKHRDHLEELVQQRTEELTAASNDVAAHAADLEGANRELEAFNYSVAHDLRRPLTVINGYCQAIRELCGDKLDALCNDYLQCAYEATLRMNQLIDALLNFSRLGHVEPRRQTVDLSAVAHEVALELKMTAPDRRITFLIAEGVSVVGDAVLLRVVLDNLLGNAWKYSGMRDDGLVEFGIKNVDGKPVCFVSDNGIGFDMADLGKLFIPFQLLPGPEEWRGFGIGLATVERIIRRHGGRVWAEGESGKGATFYFTLQGT